MFNLEQAIADWRQQMLAAGIQTPVPLEELESHLREEIDRQVESGQGEPEAFAMASGQIGRTDTLKTEFAKVGAGIYERLRRLGCALAGIPEYQLATNMNVPNQNFEPAWTTYLKNAAYVIPAFLFWTGSLVLVVPKLKEVCFASGTALPGGIILVLNITQVFKEYALVITAIILTALILLEWRSRRWPRYRRMVFGFVAYLLNFGALFFMAAMCVLAVIAAANSLHR
jgi:hypothetical protein